MSNYCPISKIAHYAKTRSVLMECIQLMRHYAHVMILVLTSEVFIVRHAANTVLKVLNTEYFTTLDIGSLDLNFSTSSFRLHNNLTAIEMS